MTRVSAVPVTCVSAIGTVSPVEIVSLVASPNEDGRTGYLAVAPARADSCGVDCVPTAYAMGYVLPSLSGLFKLGFALDSR